MKDNIFDSLPENIKTKLGKIHTHAELCEDEEIVYKEKDVIKLVLMILDNKKQKI